MSTAPTFQTADKLLEPRSVSDEIAKALRVRDEAILKLTTPTEQTHDVNPTLKQSGVNIRPEEKQALVQLLSDLGEQGKSQAKQIAGLQTVTKDQAEQIGLLRDGIVRLQGEVASCVQFQGRIAEDLARGLQRIRAIEDKNKPQKTDVTLGHINTLAAELLTRAKAGQRGVTYAEAARILKLDKSRVCQLRGLIASDSRFNVDWHPNRKNMKVICLKNYKAKEIAELNVQ